MSDELTFVDTNVLVYAYDRDAGDKHRVAQELLSALWADRLGTLSIQVLQEFWWTVTRKLPKPLGVRMAREVMATYRAWPVFRPSVDDVLAATEIEERHQLAFWDALIVLSAERSGATILLSEDLSHGERIGGVTVSNPFRAS